MITEDFLMDCYKRAERALSECIADPGNRHLGGELKTSWERVRTVHSSIVMSFVGSDHATLSLQTRIDLVSDDGTSLGYYRLDEDRFGNILDDFLVFE